MHSYFNDGGQSPELVARAAKANGLHYMFLTDIDPQDLLNAGLQRFNGAGEFLALPAEEVAGPSAHINGLNIRRMIDYHSEDIPRWLAEIRSQGTNDHPTAIQLNHPSHVGEITKYYGYFRSWWVADVHSDVDLVENFDFRTWFDHLNRNNRVTGVWTTDSHDVTFVPPGKKKTYVYVGERFDEQGIIDSLVSGRCFSTRSPGAVLMLTVNGAMIGDTVAPKPDGTIDIRVRCEAARPLRNVELIGNGEVIRVIDGQGCGRLDATVTMKAGYRWIIARAYVHESNEDWPKDGTSMEPLLASGCVAFTNPVWIERSQK